MSQDRHPNIGDAGNPPTAATVADALKDNGPRADLSGIGFNDLRKEYTEAAAAQPETTPTYTAPTLDEIMPPLDRNGKRGALNAAERDYKHRRQLLAELLEQHAATCSTLADKEVELAMLQGSHSAVLARNEEFVIGSANMTRQVRESREARSKATRCALITLTAATQFTRLSGLELGSFQAAFGERIDCTILGYSISVAFAPLERQLLITSNGHTNKFDLTTTGEIQPKDALAILSLLGVKRDLKEALSAMAVRDLFGTTATAARSQDITSPLYGMDPQVLRIAQALGRVAVVDIFPKQH